MRLLFLMPLLWGCRDRVGDAETTTSAFTAPWEGLSATDEATGAFEAEIGDDLAGPGWFHTDDREVWGAEGAWARASRPEGASVDVVAVSIAGRVDDGLAVLQLVFARSTFVEGSLAIDGTVATGVVTIYEEDGLDVWAYVVGGEVEVTENGNEDGEDVEGTFTDIELATGVAG